MPRIAKAMMSAREAAEFFAYAAGNPLDDQSNHHLPIASLQASYLNSKRESGKAPFKIQDFLLFGERKETDVEDDLLNGDW